MMALFCLVQHKSRVGANIIDGEDSTATVVLDMAPAFADDGVMAGKTAQVLAAHRAQMQLAPLLGLEYNYTKAEIVTAAGERYAGDLSSFHGDIPVNRSRNFKVIKVPIGSAALS